MINNVWGFMYHFVIRVMQKDGDIVVVCPEVCGSLLVDKEEILKEMSSSEFILHSMFMAGKFLDHLRCIPSNTVNEVLCKSPKEITVEDFGVVSESLKLVKFLHADFSLIRFGLFCLFLKSVFEVDDYSSCSLEFSLVETDKLEEYLVDLSEDRDIKSIQKFEC